MDQAVSEKDIGNYWFPILIYEPRHKKTCFFYMDAKTKAHVRSADSTTQIVFTIALLPHNLSRWPSSVSVVLGLCRTCSETRSAS